MIPTMINSYLRDHNLRFEHFVHGRVVAAQRLAAAEHVPGVRVAKVVVVSVDGKLSLAVVPAPSLVDTSTLCEALHANSVELVPEDHFADKFWPCEPGAEPPLSMFGLPIFVDAGLARQPWILARGGTHEDAIQLDTDDWLLSEHARIVEGLAAPALH
ncbi:MAG TPA: YbaK/EbsC family protein [Anaeromyxobacteraceae bacterium]|nr:YbaK/EbsC family protein [Anaeromyxobacteraceae bacterium]